MGLCVCLVYMHTHMPVCVGGGGGDRGTCASALVWPQPLLLSHATAVKVYRWAGARAAAGGAAAAGWSFLQVPDV